MSDTAHVGRALVDLFGQGWSRGNPDTIVSVFTATAKFLETPFSEPLVGIAAIREYWREIPYYQSEINFTSGEIFVVGPWFSTEFKCTFRRRRTGELVDARGALFCETDGEKITEMRMYWHRWGERRD